MSHFDPERSTDRTGADRPETDADSAALHAELDVLREENERLRSEVRRARQTRYRRSALALSGVGVAGLLAAAALPAVRDVLLVLGATGVFAGVVTYYLTPERVLTASVAARLTETVDTLDGTLAAELGLRDDTRIYAPGGDDPGDARLFVPQHADYRLPETLDALFAVGPNERENGIALPPTGAPLLEDLTETLIEPLSDDPATAADQLADAVVEQFELARGVETDVDDERVTYAVRGPVLGSPAGFDDPLASTLAVGTALALSAPVELDVTDSGDDRADVLVTCRRVDAEGTV